MIRKSKRGPAFKTTPECIASEYYTRLFVHHCIFCRSYVGRVRLPSWSFLVRAQRALQSVCLTSKPEDICLPFAPMVTPRLLHKMPTLPVSDATLMARMARLLVVPSRPELPLSLMVDQNFLCQSTNSTVVSMHAHNSARWPPGPCSTSVLRTAWGQALLRLCRLWEFLSK